MMKKILFVNHKSQKCGIHEFGYDVGQALQNSNVFNFKYIECDSWIEFKSIYFREKPDAVIYNYNIATMPWISNRFLGFPNSYKVSVPQIGIIHEVYQELADNLTDALFNYHISADPTLLLKNPIVFKTGRLVPFIDNSNRIKESHEIKKIGSFGFATNNKNFKMIIEKVQNEFDEAIININIPSSDFADKNGDNAKLIARNIKDAVKKSGIEVNISHDYLNKTELLEFLANNDLNCFFYDYCDKRGISSATDWALAVNKPIAITRSMMFRHLFECYPSICIEDNSLQDILKNTGDALKKYSDNWSEENLIWDYERIINIVLKNNVKSRFKRGKDIYQSKLSKVFFKKNSNISNPWVKSEDENIFSCFIFDEYKPVNICNGTLNRILNDEARELYFSANEFIKKLVPEMYLKKIEEANIQQAFVFDAAYNIANMNKNQMRLLAVGAFEDTAVLALKKMAFYIDEIDPVINYDLSTFLKKPSTNSESYDLVLSTSVIEHVKDDEQFIRDIAYLLKPGGIAILTCDFKNDYEIGDAIPDVDYRFYTKKDLEERLLSCIPDCSLLDQPSWDCTTYDFTYLGKYNYTFASFVFKKNFI